MAMKPSSIQLNDLPDELLMLILQKLKHTDVLYSLWNVNHRLNRIVRDPIFTSCLILLKWIPKNIYDLFSSNGTREKFCREILPEIHDQIKWLNVDSSSMKDVLRAADYPNLHTLGLFNLNLNSIQCLCRGEILFLFKLKHFFESLVWNIFV